MTAVDVDALAKLRSAATAWFHESGLVHSTAVREWCECQQAADLLLPALLPVVDRIANERAAAELRAAADNLVGERGLRAHGEALDGAHPCSGRFCRTCADEATS